MQVTCGAVQQVTHSEGNRAWHLFITAGMEGGATHPGLQYLQIFGLHLLVWMMNSDYKNEKFFQESVKEVKQLIDNGSTHLLSRIDYSSSKGNLAVKEKITRILNAELFEEGWDR